MALILPFNGTVPKIDQSTYLAENATVTGDVTIGKHCSLLFHVAIRGDVNKIIIGDRVNIQDGAVVHGSYQKGDTVIGNDVSVGHKAIVHGCTIKNNVLIGMGAIVLDDVIVEENVVVAAGAVVTQNQTLESGYIYAGIPAKKIKPLTPKAAENMIGGTVNGYVRVGAMYKKDQD